MNPDSESHRDDKDGLEDRLSLSEPWFVTDVKVSDEILGRGSYGTVYVGHWLGTKVAVKKLHEIYFEMIASPAGRLAVLGMFAREINFTFQLRHPNIAQFFGVYKASGSRDLDVTSDTCLVLELMRCPLNARNRTPPRLNLRNVVDLSLGIVSALRYLHERPSPIIHRDVATKNILLTDGGTPKIADLSVAMTANCSGAAPRYTRVPGTELYMPPETRLEGSPYSELMDVFSFGIILLELCIGRDTTAAGEPFKLDPHGSGMVTVVPETERRKKDFDDLGDHVLKPLILQCLSTQDSRPASKVAFEQLVRVSSSAAYAQAPDVPVFARSSDSCDVASGTYQRGEKPWEVKDLEVRLEEATKGKERLQTLLKAAPPPQPPASLRPLSPAEIFSDVEARNQRSQLHMRVAQLEKEWQQEVLLLKAQVDKVTAQREALEEEVAKLRSEALHHVKAEPLVSSHDSQVAQPPDDEVRRLKKMVEKYKAANINLDSKLKDTMNELQKHMTGQTPTDVSYKRDLEGLHKEIAQLRLQLDRALLDNARLQSEVVLDRKSVV